MFDYPLINILISVALVGFTIAVAVFEIRERRDPSYDGLWNLLLIVGLVVLAVLVIIQTLTATRPEVYNLTYTDPYGEAWVVDENLSAEDCVPYAFPNLKCEVSQ